MYFFLQAIREVDSRYGGLFGKEEGIDEGDETETNGFIESFGWVYSAKQVAKHNGIKLNEAWDLSYVEFLNSLAYIKSENEYMKELSKKK